MVNCPSGKPVLLNAHGGGLDDSRVGDFRLKQLADDRKLRYDPGGLPVNPLGDIHIGNLRAEAGPIQQVDVIDSVQLFLRQHGGSVQHLVPAFGVTAHIPDSVIGEMVFGIVQGQLLGFRLCEADHEILFPTGHGAVRSPVGDKGPVTSVEAYRRELNRGRVVQKIHIV